MSYHTFTQLLIKPEYGGCRKGACTMNWSVGARPCAALPGPAAAVVLPVVIAAR